MSDIKKYPGIRHFRGSTTRHVIRMSNGTIRNQGVGQSFWYRPLNSVLSELPIDDCELPLFFHARTADFQDLTVQATLTFRFIDPVLASSRLDFEIDPDTGAASTVGHDQVVQILTEIAQGHALNVLSLSTMPEALAEGVAVVRDAIADGLATESRLVATGIEVLGIRVLALRPESDMERALQTPAREAVQGIADKATFERRAMSVDLERSIAENELANKIELAVREQQLVIQEGANARRRAEEDAGADAIRTKAESAKIREQASATSAQIREIGAAKADQERALLEAFKDIDRSTLMILAIRDLSENLPAIQSLTITPDLITGALAGLIGSHEPTQ